MASELNLVFAGDLLLGGEWPQYAESHGVDLLAPFENVKKEIESADIFFVNLEGPIAGGLFSEAGTRAAKLRNHPRVIELLKRARTCVCVLANNHIMDAGMDGLRETRQLLEAKGIHCVGAGLDNFQAEQAVVIECKGNRIGCLAFSTSDAAVGATIARDGQGGCADLNNLASMESAIKALKASCQVVVVSLHWGAEFFEYPTDEQVTIVDRLIDAGADYIMGHHPHVLQGVEQRDGCLAMYSLGHFFVPPFRRADGELIRPKAEAREFGIVRATIRDDARQFEIVGGRMTTNMVLQPYDAAGQRALGKKLESLAPNRIENYAAFAAKYRAKRSKELRRERKVEALSGFIREPLTEIKRRIGGRAAARSAVSA